MREHTTHHHDCGCLSEKHEAELARLRAQLAEVTGEREQWREAYDKRTFALVAAEARLRECEGALEPFAAEASKLSAAAADGDPAFEFVNDGTEIDICVGDLRRAASLLAGARAQKGGE